MNTRFYIRTTSRARSRCSSNIGDQHVMPMLQLTVERLQIIFHCSMFPQLDKFVQLLIVVPFRVLLSCYILLCAMLVGHYISPDKTIGKQFPQEKTIIENI